MGGTASQLLLCGGVGVYVYRNSPAALGIYHVTAAETHAYRPMAAGQACSDADAARSYLLIAYILQQDAIGAEFRRLTLESLNDRIDLSLRGDRQRVPARGVEDRDLFILCLRRMQV